MKKALFSIFAMVTCMGVFAQELIVVVAPFDVRSGFSKSDVETIEHLFLLELAKTKSIKVLDQSDAMFKENINRMQFELSDWSNPDKVAEFGKALNANAVVLGRMMTLGDEHIITARINTLDTEIQAANDMAFKNVSEIRGKLPDFAKGIVDRLPKPPPPVKEGYSIGDKGPAGGIVFYDKGSFSNGWRYLEAAPVETEFLAEWGLYKRDVPGTGTAVGNGKRNTQLIVEQLRQRRETGRAAQLCANLNFDGYKDWFLPSKDELDLMYRNLKQRGLGGFGSGRYWSSTHFTRDSARVQLFYTGEQTYGYKTDKVSVRAIRQF